MAYLGPADVQLGEHHSRFQGAIVDLREEDVVSRIWDRDYTVWASEPDEITDRLGWLDIAQRMREAVPELKTFVRSVEAAGITDVLLLGMGGASLTADVFSRMFGEAGSGLTLSVLDSTDPGAILAEAERLDPAHTLFIVATKSGSTVETLSLFKYFYTWIADVLGDQEAGEHFVAITDPGTPLVDLADRYGFRSTFINDPNIGGRFSALSYFGLVPGALIGVEIALLLDRAEEMMTLCGESVPAQGNPGTRLGAILGELAKAGADKATFVFSESLTPFGDWLEQLIAESTGKEGTGILPVVGEPVGPPETYAKDRLFIYLQTEGEITYEAEVNALEAAGYPVVRIRLSDRYDIAGQFFLWEFATAVAGHLLGIHPFSQPNVESAKVEARKRVEAYRDEGSLPEIQSAPLTAAALNAFLAHADPGDPETGAGRGYVSIHAYLPPKPETSEVLERIQKRVRDRFRLATTVGYGPRFLHSTGQLHKGDAGNGLFIQLTADHPRDVPIPNEAGSSESSLSFGVLERAQALGDRQALLNVGRRVIHFHLGVDVLRGLERMAAALAE